MRLKQSQVEELTLKYELSMAIGTSLETHPMLKHALDAFLEKLNCAAGSIFLRPFQGAVFEPACAIPGDVTQNRSCIVVQEDLDFQTMLQEPGSLQSVLPIQGGDPEQGFHHILELPDVGFMVLVKHRSPLQLSLVASLEPLLNKLANAISACTQIDDLAHALSDWNLERNMLRTLINNTPLVACAVDRDGIFTFFEGYSQTDLGRERGEAVGLSVFDYYADVPTIVQSVQRALEGDASSVTVHMGGRSFDARYEPIFGADGTIDGVVGIAHDVTERKRTADSLSAVLDTVGEGIVTIDPDGRIVLVNRMIESIFGYDHNSLLGESIESLMPEQYRSAHRKGMHRYQSTGVSTVLGSRIELEGARSDGTIFPLEIRIEEVNLGGIQHFTASMRDIGKAKELDRMRDEFVATVSHELRTPLASVMGWTETLLSEKPGPLSDTQRRFLDIVYRSSERLDVLVEEIMTVSRIQRGTLEMGNEPFYPGSILDGVLELIESTAASRAVTIRVDNRWPQDLAVIGDGKRIEQVIVNLVENAIKFSPENSEITILSLRDGDLWHIDVCDQGIGIEAEEIPHVFERFYRAESAKNAQIQGTGIGLYICKAIVDGHRGDISVRSELGSGTTVSISIPAGRIDKTGSSNS